MRSAAAVLGLALAAPAAGCLSPPVIFEAGAPRVDPLDFPPGTVEASAEPEPGVRLRGVFVPSDPGAPVVAHLLGSGASVTDAAVRDLAWELRHRGFASLLLDYRGVGPSEGSRSAWNLRGDARAAVEEAARRAGGPGRVVVRGMSMGTLAAATVLEDGPVPAAAVLVVPVRAETVATNYLYSRFPDVLAFLSAWAFRRAGDADLLGALRGPRCPVVVLAAGACDLLPPDELALLEEAARAGGARVDVVPGRGHGQVYLDGLVVFPAEEELLARLFPGVPDAAARAEAAAGPLAPEVAPPRARLEAEVARHLWDPPALAAALAFDRPALEGEAATAYEEWLRSLPADALRGLGLEALRALVSMETPDGPLDARELPRLLELVAGAREGRGAPLSPEALVDLARRERLGRCARWRVPSPPRYRREGVLAVSTMAVDLDRDDALPVQAPARLLLPPEASFRQGVRLLLKAAGLPVREGAGGPEVLESGAWRPLAMEP